MSADLHTVVVMWVQFGPYHLARLEATGRYFSSRGVRVIGLEVATKDSQYAWDAEKGAKNFRKVTLFPESDYHSLGHRRISEAIQRVLGDIDPGCVAINGWAGPEALGALGWCVRNHGASVLMSDSKADDFTRNWWKEFVKSRIARSYGAALVAGTPHRDYAVKLGLPPERTFLGYDVVDNEYFSQGAAEARGRVEELRRRLNLPREYFLAVTRLIEVKNVERLLQAYRLYRHHCERSQAWALVICGSGPREDALKAMCKELRLSDVLWPGFVQIADLPNYYGLAGAFILPSLKDSWGLVVNEAMASGLPVLVSRSAGCCSDLVRDGGNGGTFDSSNVNEMAVAMLRMSQLPLEERQVMGEKSAQIISEWGLERFAEGLWSAVQKAHERRNVGVFSKFVVSAASFVLSRAGT